MYGKKIQFVPLSRRVWVWRKDPKRPWCPFSWVSWLPERRQWVFRMRAHNVRKGKGHPNTDYFHRRQEPNPSTLQWDPPSPPSSKAVGIRLEEYSNKSDMENWKKWSSCHSNIGSQVYDTQKSHFGRKLDSPFTCPCWLVARSSLIKILWDAIQGQIRLGFYVPSPFP